MPPDASPPPLPRPQPQPPSPAPSRSNKLVVTLSLIPAFFVAAVVVLRLCGLLGVFSVPAGSMAPAVSPGDHILTEGVTFLFRPPRRGDIVVFKSDSIPGLPSSTLYFKRVAGEPGDHLRISAGKLFVNDTQVTLSNATGPIVYDFPTNVASFIPQTDVTVPRGMYFLLGDNSTNSLDSRFWGSLPRGNIVGRVLLCYWPLQRAGGVK